jgi:Flp pilus assembly protein TadD
MQSAMKHIPALLFLSIALTLTACGQAGKQWFDPDVTFASLGQPTVKGVNDTQEDMAKEAAANGDYGRAVEFYQQIMDSKKGTPEQLLRYKLAMADATRRLGKNEAALAMYEELYSQNASNIEVMEGRGLSLMANGKVSDAGRAFSEVIEKDPKRWRTLNAIGILFVTKNMVPEAVVYYTEALTNSPDNPAILNNVGLSYATDKNYPRAIEALKQASRMSKAPYQRKQIDLNLAMVHGVSGDFDSARDVAGKYLEGPALDNNLGLYAHLAKDDSLAKSYLNMALTQSPTYYERAWENLDVVNDTNQDEADKPVTRIRETSTGNLPKLDALRAPETKTKRKGSKVKATAAKATANDTQVEPTLAVRPTVKDAEVKPVEKKSETVPEVKATDKPAGLIIAPGE